MFSDISQPSHMGSSAFPSSVSHPRISSGPFVHTKGAARLPLCIFPSRPRIYSHSSQRADIAFCTGHNVLRHTRRLSDEDIRQIRSSHCTWLGRFDSRCRSSQFVKCRLVHRGISRSSSSPELWTWSFGMSWHYKFREPSADWILVFCRHLPYPRPSSSRT